MNKNRIFIIAASAAAILGSFLPWATASAGALGSMTVSGTQGDGWLIIFLAIGAIVLSCLKNYEKPTLHTPLYSCVALSAGLGVSIQNHHPQRIGKQ